MKLQANFDFQVTENNNASIIRRLEKNDPSLVRLTVILLPLPSSYPDSSDEADAADSFNDGNNIGKTSRPSTPLFSTVYKRCKLSIIGQRGKQSCKAFVQEQQRFQFNEESNEFHQLGEALGKNTTLKKLIVRITSPEPYFEPAASDDTSNSSIFSLPSYSKLKIICQGLLQNSFIEHLSLVDLPSLNTLSGDAYCELFASFLEHNPNMKSVHVSKTFSHTNSIANANDNSNRHTNIADAYNGNGNSRTSLRSLYRALSKRSTPLSKLSLFHIQLNDYSVQELADAFSQYPDKAPLEMELNDNNIGVAGCVSLASKLINNLKCSAVKVDLSGNNQVSDEGAKVLAEALKTNTKLQKLWLCGTSITMDGWNAFVNLVCNDDTAVIAGSGSSYTSSGGINAIYQSNHALSSLGHFTYEKEALLPTRLLKYLKWNECEDKLQVARRKILWLHYYFDCFDNNDNKVADSSATNNNPSNSKDDSNSTQNNSVKIFFGDNAEPLPCIPQFLSWLGNSNPNEESKEEMQMSRTALYETVLRMSGALCR